MKIKYTPAVRSKIFDETHICKLCVILFNYGKTIAGKDDDGDKMIVDLQ